MGKREDSDPSGIGCMDSNRNVRIVKRVEITEEYEIDEPIGTEDSYAEHVNGIYKNEEVEIDGEVDLEEAEYVDEDPSVTASDTSSYYPAIDEIFFTKLEQNVLYISFIIFGLVYALISFICFFMNLVFGFFLLIPAYSIYYFCGSDPSEICWGGYNYFIIAICILWFFLVIFDFCCLYGCVCGISFSSCSFESRDRVSRWTQTILPTWWFKKFQKNDTRSEEMKEEEIVE